MAICSKCKEDKDASAFYKNARKSSGHRSRCKTCEHDDVRESKLKKEFGISSREYDRLLLSQGGVCAICGSDKAYTDERKHPVDHDHITGEVRGILCGSCNRGLGYFQDDVDRLIAAAMYLMKSQDVLDVLQIC